MSDDRDDDKLFGAWIRSGSPVSIIATAFTVLSVGLLVVMAPTIEGTLFPIFSDNQIPRAGVTRDGQKLCWHRIGYKLRAPPLVDFNVDVDYISEKTGKLAHQPTPALYSGETGQEITSDDAPPAGAPFDRVVCLNLSPRIKLGQPIRVRQTAFFESKTNLYNIPVMFPLIIDPPDSAAVFARMHDRARSPEEPSAIAGPQPDRRSDAEEADDVVRRLAEVPDDTPKPEAPYAARIGASVSAETKAEVERYRQAHGLRSIAAAVRELLARGLADDDRDALGPYEPGKR